MKKKLSDLTREDWNRLFPVELVDQNPEWKTLFEEEKARIIEKARCEIILRTAAYTIFLICFLFGLSAVSFAQENLKQAKSLIEQLKKDSPEYHGIPLNRYLITDIDFDGIFEVVECVNRIENEWTGALNVEMAPAFDYENIFRFEAGSFTENYSNYKWYLNRRLVHYKLWKNLIVNPVSLTPDSERFIEDNKDHLLNEIERLITLTNERLKE